MGWRSWLIVGAALSAVTLLVALAWPPPGPPTTWLSRPANAQPMVVIEVLNGDTVRLTSAHRGPQVHRTGDITARLLGIDAPNFGIRDECYAQEAQAKLASLLPVGTVAWVAIDEVAQDIGGRYLMYVWSSSGRFVNYELVLGGFARILPTDPPHERTSVLAGAQESATSRLRGVWGQCT